MARASTSSRRTQPDDVRFQGMFGSQLRHPITNSLRDDLRPAAVFRLAVAHRCGFCGFVAKYMGDGVLAYFGYPQAHEHDAEHAVLAGLALVEAVPMLKTAAGTPLQVRVGIATGLVVVGDLIGSGEAQERG